VWNVAKHRICTSDLPQQEDTISDSLSYFVVRTTSDTPSSPHQCACGILYQSTPPQHPAWRHSMGDWRETDPIRHCK